MARKIKEVVIGDDGRDKGKRFLITEMGARQTERWAARAFMALARSGIDLPAAAIGGMAQLAQAGFMALAQANFHEIEPLMDEIMACVEILPNPGNSGVHRTLTDDDIEEVKTLFDLKREWWTLHTAFFFNDAPSTGSTTGETTSPSS